MPNGKVAPNLAKRGIQGYRIVEPPIRPGRCFNMEDPVVGGYTPDKVALRRAIGLAFDVDARSAMAAARPGDSRAVAAAAAHHAATTRRSRAR